VNRRRRVESPVGGPRTVSGVRPGAHYTHVGSALRAEVHRRCSGGVTLLDDAVAEGGHRCVTVGEVGGVVLHQTVLAHDRIALAAKGLPVLFRIGAVEYALADRETFLSDNCGDRRMAFVVGYRAIRNLVPGMEVSPVQLCSEGVRVRCVARSAKIVARSRQREVAGPTGEVSPDHGPRAGSGGLSMLGVRTPIPGPAPKTVMAVVVPLALGYSERVRAAHKAVRALEVLSLTELVLCATCWDTLRGWGCSCTATVGAGAVGFLVRGVTSSSSCAGVEMRSGVRGFPIRGL